MGRLVCLNFEEERGLRDDTNIAKNSVVHEFGHALGLPDYYFQNVYDNEVEPRLDIASEVKDVMWTTYNPQPFFHPISREMANKTINLSQPERNAREFTPKLIILQIVNNEALPLPGAKIAVFPQVIEYQPGQLYPRWFIPNVVSFERVTDGTGRVFLGSPNDIFTHKNYRLHEYGVTPLGDSALIRVSFGNEVRYAALTLSYLNRLYFDYGQTESATITTPFSALIKPPEKGFWRILDFKTISAAPEESTTEQEAMKNHVLWQLRASGVLDR